MLFNSEFVSLLSNKVIQLISDDSIQSLACRSILTRVSDGYKKFLESYRYGPPTFRFSTKSNHV